MQHETHQKLGEIRASVGMEYGKILQKMLAISLLETKVESLVERSVQGIDLEMVIGGETCAFEVKTSEGDTIKLSRKDIEGLDRQVEAGNRAYIVVLTNGPLDELIFARYHPGEIPLGKELSSFFFRAYQEPELQQRIKSTFPVVVDKYAQTAVEGRQGGLDKILEQYGEWGRA